jgi:hypothetical protein
MDGALNKLQRSLGKQDWHRHFGAVRDKSLPQTMEALRADRRVAPRRHFHALRQGFSPPNE